MITNIIIFFGLLVLIGLITLALLPLKITIDTTREDYHVKLTGLISFRLTSDEETNELYFVFKVPFFKKTLYPFSVNPKSRKDPGGNRKALEKEGKDDKKTSWSMTPQKLVKMVRTFRIIDFQCTLDTGDFMRNAWLVPVFQVMTRYQNNLSVNFTGDFKLRFIASSNLWRLGKAYLTG